MGTPLEHCNFSRYSLFPRRSAPLRASIIGTFPSSNRAERNAFDNVPLMKNNLTEHCIMLHGSFIFPRSAPFRSVLQWWWVTHLNIGICSLRFYYFPSPFRSVCACNDIENLFLNLFPRSRSFPFVTTVTTFQRHFNTLAANPKIKSYET
jgi:hypothetical protein